MLRGLNALYLQAPFIQSPVDVADFCFLVHVWAAWVRDYHGHKEGVMIPKFEDALGLERGGLRVASTFTGGEGEGEDEGEGEGKWMGDEKGKGKEKKREGEGEGEGGEYKPEGNIPALLQNILNYTATTHANPPSYSPSTLQSLLSSLASSLVPHLHNQIPLLQQMQDLCLTLDSPPSSTSHSSSTTTTQSSSQRSTTTPSSPSPSLSLPSPKPPTAPAKSTLLTKTHLATTTSFSASLDPFTALPMIVRLRDITYDGRTHDGGVWPRLSVPALHAIADRLSPKHAGSWRFLPCDVWGRPRELEFLGEEGEEGGEA